MHQRNWTYRGMADGAAVNGKWDRTGFAGMVRRPINEIWPRSPRHQQILRRLQRQFLHLPWPRLQEGTPHNSVSQWDPWRGRGPGRKILQNNSRARRPPHLRGLLHEEDKGKYGQVQNHTIKAASRGHGTEGLPNYPWSLSEWYIQCSRHACSYHWR